MLCLIYYRYRAICDRIARLTTLMLSYTAACSTIVIVYTQGGAATLHCDGSQFNIFGDSVLCCASQQLADELLSVVKPHTVAA
jgi:hypothetical protein